LQLVQAQQTQFPEVAVVHLPFLDGQLAADDFVAGRRIALELDAADEELLAFVEIDAECDELFLVVRFGVRHGGEVDIAQRSVGLAQIVKTFADGLGVEDVAVLNFEQRPQSAGIGNRLVAAEYDRFQAIARPFLYRYLDVHGFAGG